VGRAEANPAQGKISNESPLGRALIGKKVGELVRIAAPGGETVFKIVRIE
jgi:transcription elongation factor GreA